MRLDVIEIECKITIASYQKLGSIFNLIGLSNKHKGTIKAGFHAKSCPSIKKINSSVMASKPH